MLPAVLVDRAVPDLLLRKLTNCTYSLLLSFIVNSLLHDFI